MKCWYLPKFSCNSRVKFALYQKLNLMKQQLIMVAANGFIIVSAMALLSVSIMAFHDPQSVMALVQVELQNNDAYSSIRGIYGGVGLSIVLMLVHLLKHNKQWALYFLMVMWGLYAVSRIMTILMEGPLGDFGSQWLVIECLFCGIAALLYFFSSKLQSV